MIGGRVLLKMSAGDPMTLDFARHRKCQAPRYVAVVPRQVPPVDAEPLGPNDLVACHVYKLAEKRKITIDPA